ncbi:MAG: DUF4981 domain-containing protein [Clostridiales bacterium]|nr:DUF4981 domain-containing protein [Clostridiales bacterium]
MPCYDKSYLTNPEIFAVGRLPAFSDHDCYRTIEEAVAESTSLKSCLNGRWQFFYAETPEMCPDGFEQPAYDRSGWDEINVPGHIQMQGYGVPQYTNVPYPWDGHERLNPPQVPACNPVGCYVRSFTLPADWDGMRIVLTFHGVESALFCWINGQFIGYGEDGFTPSHYDITDALHEGENLLAVQVYRYASCCWLEDQDFWRFSGIFRDVTLSAQPKAHVRDIHVRTELSDAFDLAQVQACVDVSLQDNTSAQLTAQLLDGTGKAVFEACCLPVDSNPVTLAMPVENPLLWSAETPNLYTLRLTLTDAAGEVLEIAQTDVGLRRVEIRNSQVLLNGKRLLIHGTNRHEFCAEAGRAITKEHMLEDIRQIKRHNINAVRTSHYPNNSLWYKLCDRYGIYLIDEANMETHGSWQNPGNAAYGPVPGDDLYWLPAVLDRARSMQERDKNHPSVLIWSCGNESFGGSVIREMSRQMRAFDPSRPVHYEGVANDTRYPDTTDIQSRMYTAAADVPYWMSQFPEKPFVLCEYAHTMGNSGGAMHKYLALEDAYPQYLGAFVWDYVDQALWMTAPNGKKRLAYGGDFGDRPNDGEFSGNGLVFADRTPTAKLVEASWHYQPIRIKPEMGGVTLENRCLFANADRYDLRWKLLRDGMPVGEGVVESPDVPAGETRRIALELPEMSAAGEYVLHCGLFLREGTDWATTADELMHGQSILAHVAAEETAPMSVRTVVGDFYLGMMDDRCRMMLSMNDGGGLLSLVGPDGQELICTPPQLSLYRAPTDNDRGCRGDQDDAFWQGVCMAARSQVEKESFDPDNHAPQKGYRWDLPFTNGAWAQVRYTALGGGKLKVDFAYHGAEQLPQLGAVGLALRLPARLNKVRYYGLGPQETYADRKMGACLGIYETTVLDSFTPYLRPQECGNHEDVRFLEVTDEKGHGLRVDAAGKPLAVSVLPYSAAELRNARHPDELPQSGYTWLDVACVRRGIGGDDSWGAKVHPEYCLSSNESYSFSFVISVC